jgi:hypothetical protein
MSYFPYRDYHAAARRIRRVMSTPSALRVVLDSAQSKIHSAAEPRLWALPATTIADEVQHYSKRWASMNIRGTYPDNAPGINAERAEDIAVRIKVAVQYLNLAEQADELVRPVLLYYSLANVSGALCSAFFTWKQYRETHGLSCGGGNVVWTTTVTIRDNGAFPRLVTTLFLLTGMPTSFNKLVAYSKPPTAHTGSGEVLEKFGSTETSTSLHQLTLRDLAEFDVLAQNEAVKKTFGLHKGSGVSETAFLIDAMLVFVGSSLARYKPKQWRGILDGKENDARLVFDDAFERFSKFGFDRVLATLARPDRAKHEGIGWTRQYYDNPYGEGAIRGRTRETREWLC